MRTGYCPRWTPPGGSPWLSGGKCYSSTSLSLSRNDINPPSIRFRLSHAPSFRARSRRRGFSTASVTRGDSSDPEGQSEANRSSGAAMDELLRIQNSRLREKLRKQSRTHSLLVSIVVVFALSWFPLNVLNIVLDVYEVHVSHSDCSAVCATFASCDFH